MPFPFPGMDPYIEHPLTWSDFHANLAPEIHGQLNAAIQHGGYATLLDYRRPPPPPALTEQEARWVEEHLQKTGAC